MTSLIQERFQIFCLITFIYRTLKDYIYVINVYYTHRNTSLVRRTFDISERIIMIAM